MNEYIHFHYHKHDEVDIQHQHTHSHNYNPIDPENNPHKNTHNPEEETAIDPDHGHQH